MSNTFRHNVPLPAFSGGVLEPTGNVALIPYSVTSNIGTYNVDSNTYSNVVCNHDGTFTGGVLGPDGVITLICNTNSNIVRYNPGAGSVTNVYRVGPAGSSYFNGGVLDPLGNVIMIPASSNIGVYNPSTTILWNVTAGSSFCGGCLLPTGNIVMAPYKSANVGMFDPILLTFSNLNILQTTQNTFSGASLTQDGRVILTSQTGNSCIVSTITPPSREMVLGPYFNKF